MSTDYTFSRQFFGTFVIVCEDICIPIYWCDSVFEKYIIVRMDRRTGVASWCKSRINFVYMRMTGVYELINMWRGKLRENGKFRITRCGVPGDVEWRRRFFEMREKCGNVTERCCGRMQAYGARNIGVWVIRWWYTYCGDWRVACRCGMWSWESTRIGEEFCESVWSNYNYYKLMNRVRFESRDSRYVGYQRMHSGRLAGESRRAIWERFLLTVGGLVMVGMYIDDRFVEQVRIFLSIL